MKISFALFAAAAAIECDDNQWIYNGECLDSWRERTSNSVADIPDNERAERRYEDLKDMALKHWAKKGLRGKNKFDERKYWAYGCHCFLLGDRPLSEMGMGSPVDSLDNKCKAYKDCNKCVRMKHGDQCIGEFIKYPWKWSVKSNDFVSAAGAGSCARELFECDKAFVYDTFEQKDVYNEDFHAFHSTIGFDNRDNEFCPTGGTAPIDHECCGGHDRKYHWIGLNKNQCCADGKSGIVKDANDQC